jgi:D-alanyl-D-alanine carboxypeptidase
MKQKLLLTIFVAVCLTVLPLGKNFAVAQNYGALNPAAFIESLKTELSLLKMLLTNMNAKSGINSPAYIAVELESGKTLLSKNSEQARPAASITKMMTATIARENIDENKKITLTDSMLAPAGNSSVLYAGREIDIKTLLKAALIQSSNDAAEALAQAAGKENFLALMNQKAAELGMANTVFFDPCGLNPKNKSTPADLAKLVAYVHKNHPEILAIGKSNDFWLEDKSGVWMKFQNVNNFYPLAAFVGGKNRLFARGPKQNPLPACSMSMANQPRLLFSTPLTAKPTSSVFWKNSNLKGDYDP